MSKSPPRDEGYWEQQDELLYRHGCLVREVSRMTNFESKLAPEEAELIMSAVAKYLRENNISQKQLAAAIGSSPTYISNLFDESERGKLPASTLKKLLKDVNNWMEDDFKGRKMRRSTNFVNTRVAKRELEACKHVKMLRCIGGVWAPAGTGKSVTLSVIANDIPGTIVIYISVKTRNQKGLIDAIGRALKVRNVRNFDYTFIVEQLRDTGRLLVLDQAHDLNPKTYQLLMNLNDEADLPILLVGTSAIEAACDVDNQILFGQLSSRMGYRRDLLPEASKGGRGKRQGEWISVTDLRAILFKGALRVHPEVMDSLHAIANFNVGHLRRCRQLVRMAIRYAEANDANMITMEHLQLALRRVENKAVVFPAGDGSEDAVERQAAGG